MRRSREQFERFFVPIFTVLLALAQLGGAYILFRWLKASSLAVELKDTGVRFLSIDPGEMDTRMHADAMPDADRSALARPEDVAARVMETIRHVDEIPNGAREVLR